MGDSFVNSLQRLVARFILVVGRRKKKVTSQMVFKFFKCVFVFAPGLFLKLTAPT